MARRKRRVKRARRSTRRVRRRKVTRVRRVRRTRRTRRVRRARRRHAVKSHMVRRHRVRRHMSNPSRGGFKLAGMKILPSKNQLVASVQKGAGAVASDMLRATVYTLIGRASGSVAEDVLGRLVSGALAGMLAGKFLGRAMGEKVLDGAYTVATYKLVADTVASLSGGRDKFFGIIANPFTEVPSKPLLPGFSLGTGATATEATGTAGLRGLRGIVPEGTPLPLGAVVPEGTPIPLGEAEVPKRFSSRF